MNCGLCNNVPANNIGNKVCLTRAQNKQQQQNRQHVFVCKLKRKTQSYDFSVK